MQNNLVYQFIHQLQIDSTSVCLHWNVYQTDT